MMVDPTPDPVRVLVVEDDVAISEPLVAGLERAGFTVTEAHSGEQALAACFDDTDLILLDLGLPDVSGHTVCMEIRRRSSVPVIVVTARGAELDRVALLDLGADDYVVKPFGMSELIARIRAVLRRSAAQPTMEQQQGLTIGDLVIDNRRRTVKVDGDEVALTPREFDLLAFLSDDAGAVRTREAIMSGVWDENWWGSTKTLDVHIASLRKKLGSELIETVRGIGFRLALEAPGS